MRTIKCKGIIDCKTYNTQTATPIAGWDEDEQQFARGEYLYQTRLEPFSSIGSSMVQKSSTMSGLCH
jgi:hypothetical protein